MFEVSQNTISLFVEDQFPEFYSIQGPNFIQFMENYYQWLETTGNPDWFFENASNLRDIDKTLPSYIIHFKEKYLHDIQYATIANQVTFIKNALDFYRSKGNFQSVDLFFQLVYGEDADIFYPKNYMLRVSDGQWVIPTYLEVSDSPLNLSYINKQIAGVHSGATAFVERFVKKKIGTKTVNVFFVSNLVGNFQTGELLSAGGVIQDIAPYMVGSLTTLDIIESDPGFEIGQVVNLIDQYNEINGSAIVSDVTTQSGLVNFDLINGGYGFNTNSIVSISENVLFLSNVMVSNTELEFPFLYFEQVYQKSTNTTANVIGLAVPNNINLAIGEVNPLDFNWVVGNEIYQGNTSGIITTVSYATVSSVYTAFILATSVTGGIFETTEDIFSNNGAYGLLNSFNMSIGVISISNTFLASNSWANSLLVGLTSNTTAAINSISQGTGASFSIGLIDNLENFTISADFLNGYDVANIPYLDVQLDGANSGMFINSYGFVRNPLANLSSLLIETFGGVTITDNIGTIETITNINPGSGYNTPPFVLIYDPLTSQAQLHDYIIDINTLTLNFIPNEIVTQGVVISNSTTIVVSGAQATIGNFAIVNRGTGYTNGDLATAASLGVNGVANITTFSNGTIDYLLPVNYGTDFTPSSNNITALSNATGGTSTGSGANVIAVGATFLLGDFVYESNGTANIATGTVQATDLVLGNGILYVNNVTGVFTTAFGIAAFASNTTATISSVNTSDFTVSARGYIKPTSNTSVLYVGRLSYDTSFVSDEPIIGSVSAATANVVTVVSDPTSNIVGWNATVADLVATGTGIVTELLVTSSGFGYSNGDTITFEPADSSLNGTATVILGRQGTGGGYYQGTGGFLDNDQVIQDSYYWQTFSYEVRTSVPFDTYEDIFTRVIHPAGTKLFGGVYLISNSALDIIAEPLDTIYSMYVTSNGNVEEFFHPGDIITQGDANGTVDDTHAVINIQILSESNYLGDETVDILVTEANVMLLDEQQPPDANAAIEPFINTEVIQYFPNTLFVVAMGTITAAVVNGASETMYISNTQGIFLSTIDSQAANINVITSLNLSYELLQQFSLITVINPEETTESFALGETVTDSTTSSTAVVLFSNASAVQLGTISGAFNTGDILIGATSNARATISNTAFNTVQTFTANTPVWQEVFVINLQNITGTFNIGDTVYQSRQNYNSQNAVTENTVVGFISSLNTVSMSVISPLGSFTNSSLIIDANSSATAIINGVRTANIVTANVLLANSSILQVNDVKGVFNLNQFIYGPSVFATISAQSTIITSLQVNTALNTIDFALNDGWFEANSTQVMDSNSGAIANIIGIAISGE